jgi:NAD kinase
VRSTTVGYLTRIDTAQVQTTANTVMQTSSVTSENCSFMPCTMADGRASISIENAADVFDSADSA